MPAYVVGKVKNGPDVVGMLVLGEKKGDAALFLVITTVDTDCGARLEEYEVQVKPETLRKIAEKLEKARGNYEELRPDYELDEILEKTEAEVKG